MQFGQVRPSLFLLFNYSKQFVPVSLVQWLTRAKQNANAHCGQVGKKLLEAWKRRKQSKQGTKERIVVQAKRRCKKTMDVNQENSCKRKTKVHKAVITTAVLQICRGLF